MVVFCVWGLQPVVKNFSKMAFVSTGEHFFQQKSVCNKERVKDILG